MKQFITRDQFNELSIYSKRIFGHWLADRGVSLVNGANISIGNLIEFLDEYNWWDGNVIQRRPHTSRSKSQIWSVKSKLDYDGMLPVNERYELCDALWEAVRGTLG